MTLALTPALALDYVTALSADLRAGVVLDRTGALLAGPAELAGPAQDLLSAAPTATRLEGATSEHKAFAARDDRRAVVILTGRFALVRVTHHDLAAALAAMGGGAAPKSAPTLIPEAAVEALADGFRRARAEKWSE